MTLAYNSLYFAVLFCIVAISQSALADISYRGTISSSVHLGYGSGTIKYYQQQKTVNGAVAASDVSLAVSESVALQLGIASSRFDAQRFRGKSEDETVVTTKFYWFRQRGISMGASYLLDTMKLMPDIGAGVAVGNVHYNKSQVLRQTTDFSFYFQPAIYYQLKPFLRIGAKAQYHVKLSGESPLTQRLNLLFTLSYVWSLQKLALESKND